MCALAAESPLLLAGGWAPWHVSGWGGSVVVLKVFSVVIFGFYAKNAAERRGRELQGPSVSRGGDP